MQKITWLTLWIIASQSLNACNFIQGYPWGGFYDSNHCFTLTADSRYEISPQSSPVGLSEFWPSQICLDYLVIGCSNGASLQQYNNQFCCLDNCLVCYYSSCYVCIHPSSQYINGMGCTTCVSPQICQSSMFIGCSNGYLKIGTTCVATTLITTATVIAAPTAYYILNGVSYSCNPPLICSSHQIIGCSSANMYLAIQQCLPCPTSSYCKNSQLLTQPATYSSSLCSKYVLSPTYCTKCSSGYWLYLNTVCCSLKCAQCSQSVCYRCVSPSTQFISGYDCLDCLTGYICQNSKLLMGNQMAVSCASTTSFYLDNNVCVNCTPPLICQDLIVVDCQGVYYLQGSQCFPCYSTICATCKSQFTCSSCIANYSLYQNNYCCGLNCAQCNLFSCLRCVSPNTQYMSGLECLTCSNIQSCQNSRLVTPPGICPPFAECLGSIVIGCIPDTSYYLSNNECISCMYPTICSQSIITSCSDFYILSGNSCYPDFQNMIECGDNCASCTSTVCQTCISTLYYPNGTQCDQCPSQCLTCDGSLCPSCVSPCSVCNMTNCLQCIGTYYYVNPAQQCIQCGTQCATCDDTDCLTCTQSNYYKNGSICSQCPVQCITCIANTCLTCAPPCSTCNWTQCISCLDPHSYVSGITCLSCDSTCLTCNSSQCLSCAQTNQYILGNQCLQCDSSCTTCNSTTCSACVQSSYYPNGHQCTQCPSQCLTCDGQSCSTCVSPCQACNMSACQVCIGSNYYINPTQQCVYCGQQCQTCNNNGCQICLQSNYYPDGNICSPCPDHCLTCTSQTCLTCNGNCATCNYTTCTSCISNSFYILELNCLQCGGNCLTCDQQQVCQSCLQCFRLMNGLCISICDASCATCTESECISCLYPGSYPSEQICTLCNLSCLTCTSRTNCLSCDQNSTLQNGLCICNDGYTVNNIGVCSLIDCTLRSSRSIKFCHNSDCTDGIWEYGEQCDNGNQIGCINCVIDKRYVCLNTILEPSHCMLMQTNCMSATMMSHTQVTCNSCVHGYYLIKDQYCNACEKMCLTCDSSPQMCTLCRFPIISTGTNCQICEINTGFYSDFVNNECFTKCGDNIIAGEETCDIGSQSTLGCTNCQVDLGYICYATRCEKIIYLIHQI